MPKEKRKLPFARTIDTAGKFLHYSRLGNLTLRKFPSKEILEIINKRNSRGETWDKIGLNDGTVIEPKHTGSYKGDYRTILNLFRVRKGKHSFYVKHFLGNPSELKTLFDRAKKILKEHNNKIGDFNVRLITPHILYGEYVKTLGRRNPDYHAHSILVTKFFDESRVEMCDDYIDRRQNIKDRDVQRRLGRLSIALDQIEGILSAEKISDEERLRNSFFEESTNTIWLFDL